MAATVLEKRYEKVANHVRHLVETGTFTCQDRLPSVRKLSQQLQVSLTTVLEAYRLLEDQGLIEARPQSGYYVKARVQVTAPLVDNPPACEPTAVGMADFLTRFLRDFQRRDLLQFGSACPCPSQVPTERLARTIARVVREHPLEANAYDLPPGCEGLRAQIARRSLQAGCVVAPEDVVLTIGCQEALYLCLRATCQPGDTVAVESPTFYGHLQAIERLGLKALEIPSHPVTGMSLAALRMALDEVPIKVVLCSPSYSNPTGACLSDAEKQELVELLARRQIPLIEDDIFGELGFTAQRPRAAKSWDKEGLVLLCSSFSKTLAPGYRVGWAIPGRYTRRVTLDKTFSNLASPALPALAVSAFLATGGFDHYLRQVRRNYARRLHVLAEAVTRWFPAGTEVTRPVGGFVVWVTMPDHVDAMALYDRAVRDGITLAPGPMFSARGRYKSCIRLSASYLDPEREPAIRRLGELAGS